MSFFKRNIFTNFDNVARVTHWLFFATFVLVPFSIRYVFHSHEAYLTGAYSDFTSFSIYIVDIILIFLLILVSAFHMKQQVSKLWLYATTGTVIWLIIELVLQNSTNFSLQLYFSVRFVLLLLFALAVSQLSISREKIAWVFVVLGAIQTVIATMQFYFQKSLGLYYVGESTLSPETLGVAKIVAHGTKMIRGYGTFPHPNILGAFLIVATLFNIYLLYKTLQKSRGILLTFLLLLNIFGVFVTFSRGGIIALGFGLFISIILLIHSKNHKYFTQILGTVLISSLISILILLPYLNTRTTFSDTATKERIFYTEIGKRLIISQPYFGTGAGLSVLHMKQYSITDLKPWEIQPIHNFWLLLWAEWGMGSIMVAFLVFLPVISLFKRKISLWRVYLIAIFGAIILLFMIDHYFYTLWPAQLILWLIIGLIMREISDGNDV